MIGGLSDVKQADQEIELILKNLKSNIEDRVKKELLILEGDSYKTQVVAGINYFIKAKIDKEEYIFIKVFRDLPHNNKPDELVSVKVSINKDDIITFF